MEFETVSRAMDAIEGFPANLKTVVQHLLISHHGQYEFGSPKLPMIREALAFHYLDDLDSKLAAARAALALDSGEPEWSAYSGALGRKFLRLDEFLKQPATLPATESNRQRRFDSRPVLRTEELASFLKSAFRCIKLLMRTLSDIRRRSARDVGSHNAEPHPIEVVPFGLYGGGRLTGHPVGL